MLIYVCTGIYIYICLKRTHLLHIHIQAHLRALILHYGRQANDARFAEEPAHGAPSTRCAFPGRVSAVNVYMQKQAFPLGDTREHAKMHVFVS